MKEAFEAEQRAMKEKLEFEAAQQQVASIIEKEALKEIAEAEEAERIAEEGSGKIGPYTTECYHIRAERGRGGRHGLSEGEDQLAHHTSSSFVASGTSRSAGCRRILASEKEREAKLETLPGKPVEVQCLDFLYLNNKLIMMHRLASEAELAANQADAESAADEENPSLKRESERIKFARLVKNFNSLTRFQQEYKRSSQGIEPRSLMKLCSKRSKKPKKRRNELRRSVSRLRKQNYVQLRQRKRPSRFMLRKRKQERQEAEEARARYDKERKGGPLSSLTVSPDRWRRVRGGLRVDDEGAEGIRRSQGAWVDRSRMSECLAQMKAEKERKEAEAAKYVCHCRCLTDWPEGSRWKLLLRS
eukprot:747567-Hanusia_phi.AAC.4